MDSLEAYDLTQSCVIGSSSSAVELARSLGGPIGYVCPLELVLALGKLAHSILFAPPASTLIRD